MTMQAVETHGHTTLRPLEPDPGKIMAAVRRIRTHRQEQQPRHTPASNHPLVGAPYSSRTDRARSHKRSQTSDPLHRKGGTGSGSPAILSGTNSKKVVTHDLPNTLRHPMHTSNESGVLPCQAWMVGGILGRFPTHSSAPPLPRRAMAVPTYRSSEQRSHCAQLTPPHTGQGYRRDNRK